MKPFGHFAAELAQLGGIPAEDPRRRDFPNQRDRLELGARLAARADESDPSCVSSREISRGDRTSCTGADSSQVIRLQRAQKLSSCSVIEQHQEADSVAGGGVDLYSD